jgi:PleD family two-component response regulator
MDIWRSYDGRSSLGVMVTGAVLLAHPEPESRRYLGQHLSGDGFQVLEAPWSARALDLAERASPDIVVASEPELCRRLRAGEPGRRWNRDVPVILLAEPGSDPVSRVGRWSTAPTTSSSDTSTRSSWPAFAPCCAVPPWAGRT